MGKGLVIGITGHARSGKDTFASMLAEELFNLTKKRFVLMAYANELKIRCQADFDLSYDQLWGNLKEVEDERYPRPDGNGCWTPREIMQNYGQFFRTINKNFWVDYLFKVKEDKGLDFVIITDVRHPNEADPVSKLGGINIKVSSKRGNKQTIHNANHISETAMDTYENVDFYVNNDTTLEDLRQTAVNTASLIVLVLK